MSVAHDSIPNNFPLLEGRTLDFIDEVSYTVLARYDWERKSLLVTHTLKGRSFIADFVRSGDAKFAVSLFYKDSRERRAFVHEDDYKDTDDCLYATQTIDVEFSYAPEVTPNIVLLKEGAIKVGNNSGLTEIWDKDTSVHIPSYARIALYPTLSFTGDELRSLLEMKCDESYKDGTVSTIIFEKSGVSEKPLRVACASDIYLLFKKKRKVLQDKKDAETAMAYAITTQIMCRIYAYMHGLSHEDKEGDELHSGLVDYMDMVAEETGQDWRGDDFDASLAATRMYPYNIKAITQMGHDDS